MAMTEVSREVGVVVRRRSIDNPWIDELWSPAMILDEVPATAPWTALSTEADATTDARPGQHRSVQRGNGELSR